MTSSSQRLADGRISEVLLVLSAVDSSGPKIEILTPIFESISSLNWLNL